MKKYLGLLIGLIIILSGCVVENYEGKYQVEVTDSYYIRHEIRLSTLKIGVQNLNVSQSYMVEHYCIISRDFVKTFYIAGRRSQVFALDLGERQYTLTLSLMNEYGVFQEILSVLNAYLIEVP